MTAIPATTRNYFSRANIPFGGNNTSRLILESYHTWAMAHVLLNLLTTGSPSITRTRHANSIWICRGSSDGVGGGGAISSPGVAGTNRWWNAGVFPPGGLVRASNGTNHHWMLLENVTLGYELLLNFSQTTNYLCFSIGKTATFTGGSATTCPAPSPTTKSVQMQQVAYSATDGGQSDALFGDYATTGGTNYLHFTCADNGEFWFSSTRAGAGSFGSLVAVWRTVNAHVSDTNNTFVITSNSVTIASRGAFISSHIFSGANCASLTPGGSQKTSGGIIVPAVNGSQAYAMTQAADALTGLYDATPMAVGEITPQRVRRGALPDIYMCGLETVGAPIPASGATQERIVIGDAIFPCMEVQPTV